MACRYYRYTRIRFAVGGRRYEAFSIRNARKISRALEICEKKGRTIGEDDVANIKQHLGTLPLKPGLTSRTLFAGDLQWNSSEGDFGGASVTVFCCDRTKEAWRHHIACRRSDWRCADYLMIRRIK